MIERGELWWVDLGEPRGSEPGSVRPVLVISADAYNRSGVATVICVALTSNLDLADAPGNVLIEAAASGLDRESVVNVTQIATLDKTSLTDRIGALDSGKMRLVELGLTRALELAPV